MIRAIAFDVDGVLVNSMVFAKVLARDYGLTLEDTAAFFQGPFKRCLLGEADLKAELPRFLASWGWPHSLEDFVARWFEADSELNLEMVDFATRARQRGIGCYVASTQERHRASYLEQEMGFADIFDGLFFSCRLRCQKPEPRLYELVLAEVGCEPEELLFLDDLHENVVAAREAGWNAETYRIGDNISEITGRYDIS
jgi:putative hydrolase of the HAD superfamily